MIRRSFVLGTAAVTLALGASACGGGGNSSPSPTPTPTSTVSPTPTASPTYTAFPLTANTEFRTINAFTSFTGDPDTGPIVLGDIAGTDVTLSAARFRLAALATPTAASTTVPEVLLEASEEVRFTSGPTTPPATTVKEYIFSVTGLATDPNATPAPAATAFDIAEFLNNTVSGQVTTDTSLALTRVTYTGWYRGDSATGQKRISYGVWGYQTAANDLPTTGTATYTTRIAGRAAQATTPKGSVFKIGGTATITVNFATGLVTVAATVTKIDAGGAETPFGAFSGTGAIATGLVTFNGSFDSGSPLTGTVVGGFYGSRAEQIGIALAGSGTVGGADTRVVAAVVGKKN